VNSAWQLGGMMRATLPAHKTRNWPAYNEARKRRGSLTIWFDPGMTWDGQTTGKCGRTPDDSDGADGPGLGGREPPVGRT